MHPNHLKKEYHLKQRDDLIRQLIVYMTPPNLAPPANAAANKDSKDNKQASSATPGTPAPIQYNYGEVTNTLRLNATNAITTLM